MSASSTTGHCQMSKSRPARDSSSRTMASASRKIWSRSCVISPMMRMPRPGPGNGGRQAQFLADPAYLVLEQAAQRLHQLETEVRRQPPDVVVGFDAGGASAAARLHHVRVQRALDQETHGFA